MNSWSLAIDHQLFTTLNRETSSRKPYLYNRFAERLFSGRVARRTRLIAQTRMPVPPQEVHLQALGCSPEEFSTRSLKRTTPLSH